MVCMLLRSHSVSNWITHYSSVVFLFAHRTVFVDCLSVRVVSLYPECGKYVRSVARKSEDATDLQSDLDTTEHHIRDRAYSVLFVLDF